MIKFLKSLTKKFSCRANSLITLIKKPWQKLKDIFQFSKDTLSLSQPFFRLKPVKIKIMIPVGYAIIIYSEYCLYEYSLQKAKEEPNNFSHNFAFLLVNLTGSYLIMFLKNSLGQYVKHQLAHAMKQDLINNTLKNEGIPLGIKFLQDQTILRNPKFQPLSFHGVILECNEFSDGAVQLSYNVVDTLCTFLLNGYYLIKAMKMINDNRIITGGVLLNLGCLAFTVWINSHLKSSFTEMHSFAEKIRVQFNHLQSNQSEVACLNAELFEKEMLLERYSTNLHMKISNNNLIFTYNTVNNIVYGIMPLILDAYSPLLIQSGKLNLLALYIYKQNIGQLIFSLKEFFINFVNVVPKMIVSQEKILQYVSFFKQWQRYVSERPFRINYSQPAFRLENFCVHIPKDIVDLRDFSKMKDEASLLHEVNLTLKGGIIKLWGPSGIGKSSFFKAILGFMPCTLGTVNFPCRKNEIFLMSQNTVLLDNISLLEVIFYPDYRSLNKNKVEKSKRIDKLKWLMKELKLEDKIKDLELKQDWNSILSGGEKRKICLLRALVKSEDIKVLILDEPTAHMDMEIKQKCYALIKDLFAHALVIYTEHEFDEESILNERKILLEKSFNPPLLTLQNDVGLQPERGQQFDPAPKKKSNGDSKDQSKNIAILHAYRQMSSTMRKTFYDQRIEIEPKARKLVIRKEHAS